MKEETSAGIVVYRMKNDAIEYLLLHYQAGHWDLAKGHIEHNETLEQTAMRELREETGISAEIIPGFKESFSYIFATREGELARKRVHFFLAKALEDGVKLSHEHIDFAWLPFEQALERLTYANAKELLKKASQFIDSRLKA